MLIRWTDGVYFINRYTTTENCETREEEEEEEEKIKRKELPREGTLGILFWIEERERERERERDKGATGFDS